MGAGGKKPGPEELAMEISRQLHTTSLLMLKRVDRKWAKLIKGVKFILTKNKAHVMRVALHSLGSENYVLHWLELMQRHVRPPVMPSNYKPVILVRISALERWPVENLGASDANPADQPIRCLQQLLPAGVWADNSQKSAASWTSFWLWIIRPSLLSCLPMKKRATVLALWKCS